MRSCRSPTSGCSTSTRFGGPRSRTPSLDSPIPSPRQSMMSGGPPNESPRVAHSRPPTLSSPRIWPPPTWLAAPRGDFLNMLPLAFRWSHRVIPLGTLAAAKQLRRHQLEWFKKRKGAAAWAQELVGGKRDATPQPDDALWLDRDARRLAEDAALALAENASGAVRFCYSTQVAIVMDPDPAQADARAGAILKALNEAGFPGRTETVNALEAYWGTLPGHGYPNLRRPLLSTINIADLLPVTSVCPGLATTPSPFFPPNSPPLLRAASGRATPCRFTLHDSDVGHTLVLGKTGSGKSGLLALLAAQFRRYPHAQVFAFDLGYSMWILAHAAGAHHYALAAGRPPAPSFPPPPPPPPPHPPPAT